MTWTLLFGLAFALGLALVAALSRRNELRQMRRSVDAREQAVRHGSAEAQLQHPVVDLSRCLGCGTCVAVCPEDGVLELVHGQAQVVNGARCVGVSACERECPVGAITVTLSNLETREDIPVLTESLEAVGTPGLFLAGEVTAHALIKTATDHGSTVAIEVARRIAESEPVDCDLDLCIVGAGPAGLACALEAKQQGLTAVNLEQESGLGGTVAKYPRRKLVMTQPIEMPLHGRLRKTSYSKEELMDLWQYIAAEQELDVRTGVALSGIERLPDGTFEVETNDGVFHARFVCLALGRRGMPRKLGVPGEELAKVAYSLIDAHSYQDRRILVVGGGDSAVETAMGLAEQPGNEVTLSYRRDSFFRIKTRNEERLADCIAEGSLRVLFHSHVVAIHEDAVELAVEEPEGTRGGVATAKRTRKLSLPNDEVFVMAGGLPMVDLLKRCGVSFDPNLRDKPPPVVEQGTGAVRALAIAFAITFVALAFAVWHIDYYMLDGPQRSTHPRHEVLRPSLGLGLWLGIAATALIVVNLLYLVRRSPRFKFQWGSLQAWMTSHVGTGILAFLCAMLHGAMAPGDSPGGHAFWALGILLVTGAIGRYFYSYVPRASNGRELELVEVRNRLGRMADEWDQSQRAFSEHARQKVHALIERRQWSGSFFGRVLALFGVQRDLRRTLREIAEVGERQDVPAMRVLETLALAREAHRTALMAAHYEDLRAVLNTWRYLHRWVAALLVLLVIVHIVHALTYGAFLQGGI